MDGLGGQFGREAKWVNGVKRYKEISPEDIIYRIVKLLREQILKVLITRKKRFITMCGDRY